MGIDHRTDVFSLGATLYEALTLTRPFTGDTSQQVFHQILIVDPPDPKQLRSRVPSDLAVICLKALEKDRGQRYETMAEFAADLQRHLAHEPILAKPPSRVQRMVKWTRRNPTKSVAVGLMTLALFVLSALWIHTEDARRRAVEAENQAKLDRESALASKALEAKRSYATNILATQMALQSGEFEEADRLHMLSPRGLRDWEWGHLGLNFDMSIKAIYMDHLYRQEHSIGSNEQISSDWIGQPELRPRLLDRGDRPSIKIYDVAVSPDGTKFVTGTSDEIIRIFDAQTGEVIRRWDFDYGVYSGEEMNYHSQVRRVCWTSDGGKIITSTLAPKTFVWDAETGEFERFLNGNPGRSGGAMSSNPEGDRLLMGGGPCYVWDLESGERLHQVGSPGSLDSIWSPDGNLIATVSKTGESEDKIMENIEIVLWDSTTGNHVSEIVLSGIVIDYGHTTAFDSASDRLYVGTMYNLFVLTVPELNIIQTYDIRSEEISGGVQSLQVARDRSSVIIGHQSGPIKVIELVGDLNPVHGEDDPSHWDGGAFTGLHKILRGHTGDVVFAGEILGGEMLLSGSDDGTLRYWCPSTGDAQHYFSFGEHTYRGRVDRLEWSPDGKNILTTTDSGTLGLFDTATGEWALLQENDKGGKVRIDTPGEFITSYSRSDWSPDSSHILALRENDNSIAIFDSSTGDFAIEIHSEEHIASPTWAPDGLTVLGLAGDSVCYWDSSTGRLLDKWRPVSSALQDGVSRMWLNPRGTQIALLGRGDYDIPYFIGTTDPEEDFYTHHGQYLCVFSLPSRELLTVCAPEGYFENISWVNQDTRLILSSSFGAPETIDLGGDGILASAIKIDEMKRTTSVAISPSGLRVAAGERGQAPITRVFDSESFDQLLRLNCRLHPNSNHWRVSPVAWSRDGTRLAAFHNGSRPSENSHLIIYESSAETARPMWEALNK